MSSSLTVSPADISSGAEPDHRSLVELPGFARGPVGAASAAFLIVELVVASRYGLHRDELYFLACARHLAWGYVDQPPLVPAVAWLVNGAIGPFAWALRLLPAMAGAGTVALSGLMARELGGGRCAQTIAAVATATSAELLAAFHLLSTTAFDFFFWAVILWLALRLLRTDDSRLLVLLGVVTGVALLNKWNVAFLVGALIVGIAAGRKRPLLWSRQALLGAVILVAIASPDIIWNAQHHWAQVAMLRSLHAENSTVGASIAFLPSQLIVVGPALAALWIVGLVHLWRDPLCRDYRNQLCRSCRLVLPEWGQDVLLGRHLRRPVCRWGSGGGTTAIAARQAWAGSRVDHAHGGRGGAGSAVDPASPARIQLAQRLLGRSGEQRPECHRGLVRLCRADRQARRPAAAR